MEIKNQDLYNCFLTLDVPLFLKNDDILGYNPIQLFNFSKHIIHLLDSENHDESMNKCDDIVWEIISQIQLFQLPAARAINILDELISIEKIYSTVIGAADDNESNQKVYIEKLNKLLENAKIVYDKLKTLLSGSDDLETSTA